MKRKRAGGKAVGKKKVHFIPKGYHSVTPYLACRGAGSRVMLADEHPEMDFVGPQARGGTAVHLHVYVKDVDALIERAVAAGAKLVREVKDQFYGDRSGSIEDPFGHVWHFATHKEDLSPAQMKKRAAEAMKGSA